MPERFYAAAQTGFSGAGSCRRANKTTRTAGVPLRTGKTGCHTHGDCCCANKTTRGGVAGIEATCGDFAGDCKNKIARQAVRSYSRP